RAALWARWGDRARAAIAAARAGRGFGYALIALGFLQVVTGRGFDGLWLALIGLFLVNAASAEEQQARLGTALHGVRVGDVMSDRLVVAHSDETVAELVDDIVMRHRLSTYPLVDDAGRFAGLVTLNRIRGVPPEVRAVRRLREIACPPEEVPVARRDEPLTDLLPRMGGCSDGRAVVLDPAGRLLGLITPSDISRVVQTAELRSSDPYPGPRGADVAVPYQGRDPRGGHRDAA
uniref:CBS domain-containing protein n=1 Tax=Nonomuraea lactucae TaxID=2249762 RepID=UPI000DE24763